MPQITIFEVIRAMIFFTFGILVFKGAINSWIYFSFQLSTSISIIPTTGNVIFFCNVDSRMYDLYLQLRNLKWNRVFTIISFLCIHEYLQVFYCMYTAVFFFF